VEIAIVLLSPFEMLLVNLFVVHQCSERKHSLARTFVILGLFTCALLSAAFMLLSNLPTYGSGNGLFIFFGFLYYLPVRYLYDLRGIRVVTIASFSWSYTLMLFALSAIFGRGLDIPGWTAADIVLLVQTTLYLVTFKAFYKMLKTKFIFVIENMGGKEAVAFMLMTMMWFWTMFILNMSFVYSDTIVLEVLTYFTLATCLLSSFRYIYMQVDSDKKIQNLEEIAYQDTLTQLRSRVVLISDAEDLVSRKIPFYLIFFDLDDFKSINDRFGHAVGDEYLAFFAYEIKVRTGNKGGFYRLAGDEFVCILAEDGDDGLELFLERISALPKTLPNSKVKFLGFSYGVASYPADGSTPDELLQSADENMYEMKRSKKTVRLQA